MTPGEKDVFQPDDGELHEELSWLEAGLLVAKQEVDSGIMSTDEYHSLEKYVSARQAELGNRLYV